jgi:hypothetical protein
MDTIYERTKIEIKKMVLKIELKKENAHEENRDKDGNDRVRIYVTQKGTVTWERFKRVSSGRPENIGGAWLLGDSRLMKTLICEVQGLPSSFSNGLFFLF